MVGIVGYFDLNRNQSDDIFYCGKQFDEMIFTMNINKDDLKLGAIIQHDFAFGKVHNGVYRYNCFTEYDEVSNIAAVVDGLIYGYDYFSYGNDATYVIEQYKKYGIDFIKNLNGNFTLLIYDYNLEKIIIANDRFGFNVHFYTHFRDGEKNIFMIAPEAKAFFFPGSPLKKELDTYGMMECLTCGRFLTGRTFFENVFVLEPATIMEINSFGERTVTQYWKPVYKPDYSMTEDYIADELVKRLRHAVELRLRLYENDINKNKFGVTLSGGLDSRSVLAAIPDMFRHYKVTAFTFGNHDCDEVKVASMVTKKLQPLKHVIIPVTPEMFLEYADKETWNTDGRNYIGNAFAHPMMHKVKEYAGVIFDGSAMDLTLGGSYLGIGKRVKNEEELLIAIKKKFLLTEDEVKQLFAETKTFPPYVRTFAYNYVNEMTNQIFDNLQSEHLMNKLDEFFLTTHVAWMHIGDAVVRNHVEVSHPTADNDFIDFILTIPPELRANHHIYYKFLTKLNKAMMDIPYQKTMIRMNAPDFLVKVRHAYTFGKEYAKVKMYKYLGVIIPNKRSYVNFDEWFRGNKEFANYFAGIIEDAPEEYFNKEYLRQILRDEITGQKSNAVKLMWICTFILFYNQHFVKVER